MDILEAVGIISGLGYVIMNARQHLSTWLFGLVSALLYVLVFLEARLYASAALSCFFACFMLYGWYRWSHPGSGQAVLPVRSLSTGLRLAAIAVALALSGLFVQLGGFFPEASLLPGDAAIAGCSIVAQALTAQKFLEAWYAWIAVNALAVCIYAASGLAGTAVLYVFYIILAVYGLLAWRRSASFGA